MTDRIWQFSKRRFKGSLRHLWDQALLLEYWRGLYMASRYVVLSRTRGIQKTDGPNVAPHTVSHNLKGLRDMSVVRSDSLVKPLSVLECIDPDAKILCVGPRTEGELYNLAAHGFALENIRGVDLISYSPRIDLGDMHALPYPNDSWDVVVCGWVLAYSNDRPRAASELLRVCRDGGVIAVGVEHNPNSVDAVTRQLGYTPGSQDRVESVEELIRLFGQSVDRVYFSQEPIPARRDRLGSITAIFSVRKRA